MRATLPGFLQTMLANCPRAGGGVHAWLYATARQLHTHIADKREQADLLAAYAANCGRHIPRREIEAAVRDSEANAWRPQGPGQAARPEAKPTWPAVNQEQREAVLRDGIGLADLWEASPVRLDDDNPQTEAIVDQLFPGGPLLCVGQSNSVFDTKAREAWRAQLAGMQLIVPSPMTALTGLTKEGKESAHALSNTGPRRFLVIEFDRGSFDEHATLLWHLATYAPLVLAVHSGSKSLHGWFYCASQPEDTLRRFMRYAVSLGADFRTWFNSQFVRMPDGTRDNGNRQAVHYFNPKLIK